VSAGRLRIMLHNSAKPCSPPLALVVGNGYGDYPSFHINPVALALCVSAIAVKAYGGRGHLQGGYFQDRLIP
jgi:hypothetical protein